MALRYGSEESIEESLSNRLNDADSIGDFIAAEVDFSTWDGVWIVRLDIVLIDNSHFVCQQMPFLEDTTCFFPIIEIQDICKIDGKRLDYTVSSTSQVLELNVSALSCTCLPAEPIKR
jgi:tRNA(Ser,Leu) C12 N-acetylase TAN1